ncbi:TetR/AcrR family transcriptional regulator [Paenibacillus sp. JX-17]|uniref:TetR/AcrR family transcriptional regulator n=1 Tax=Paenibacillus lacisoli TaxID=3064525 RepID=A0ABT9CD40_9BACL|nr:TetR/AcrR family transcriptional regulator [Paenibacillus sp. JX-17]MDO7907188.1 TetR/AcrR family transcriptional regulator [Paenibacillus sp. JX-17]
MTVVDRRSQVLKAASQSFALFGYKATTMEQVAKIANVGKGTIYTFFTNKEELFDEILRSLILEMKRIAEAQISHDRPFFDNLFRVLDALLEFRTEHELFIKLMQEVRDFGTAQAVEGLYKVEEAIAGYIEQEIRLALERQEMKPCDPQVVSYVLLKLYVTLTTDWSRKHVPLTQEQIRNYLQLFVMDGLAAAPALDSE